jgi:hypothetical protein
VALNFATGSTNAQVNNDFIVSPIRPNPSNGNLELLLQTASPGDITVEIRNMLGQSVYFMKYPAQTGGLHQYSIHASSLSSGLYLLTVTGNNRQHSQKISIR